MIRIQTSSPLIIHAPAQIRALASPARQEIVDALVAAGPCSIAELAAHTGRAPDSLYHHIRLLKKSGLILERNPRKSGRHIAAIYDLPGRPVFISYRDAQPRSLNAVVAAALRLGLRDFRRALDREDTVADGPARNLWGGRVKGWVGPEELLEINTLLRRLYELIHTGAPGPGRRPQTFSFALAPVQPSPRSPGAEFRTKPARAKAGPGRRSRSSPGARS
ncbi:MAG: helix-turn-helix transcriptional regulator [Phycisphaerales bacterium]|nr:helix-turn-helix transcriptional regulator [Phycisphaerales bacterium]